MGKRKKSKKENTVEVVDEAGNKVVSANSLRMTGFVLGIIWLILLGGLYYLLLPACNIHSVGMWVFVIFGILLPLFFWFLLCDSYKETKMTKEEKKKAKMSISLKVSMGLFLAVLLLFVIAGIYGMKIFHASQYASILKLEEYEFKEDLDSAQALTKIALMDTDSAILLGNREIGSLSEVVSQYSVSEQYSQIDFQGAPVKVSALEYAGFFKYLGNKEKGVPGYVCVDPVGQGAEYRSLNEGMKYIPSAYFGKDLHRAIRFSFPTEIFGNEHFEIDEEGKPWFVASVYKYTIGLFGGKTVKGAILCNPVDGSMQYYAAGDVPQWVDVVYSGDLLVEQYNWYGKLSNGFMNSIFGKKGCKKCTETIENSEDSEEEESYAPDFGYVAKDGDIWIYTGVTSVNDDASNIGFILVNERTAEAHTYVVSGADESSAMAAAEGEVQEKGYQASFPSLINVDDHPTYIMVLKDASGIVKLYAMVNVESYNIVTTSDSLEDCFEKYRKRIGSDTVTKTEEEEEADSEEEITQELDFSDAEQKTITIEQMNYIEMDGDTWVYLTDTEGKIYKQKFSEDEKLILLKEKDKISILCLEEKDGIYYMKLS